MRRLSICLVALLLSGAGCHKAEELQSKAAIQRAIEAHLQRRPNLVLASMTLEILDVKFAGDTAQAEVEFRSTRSPNLVVGVRYILRRVDNHWHVESSTPSTGMGASPHGDAAPTTPPPPAETPLKSSH